MKVKDKRGRKKKDNKLVKANFRVEQETIDKLNELASLLNEIKNNGSITFSDVARRLLDRRCTLLIKFLKGYANKIATVDEIKAAAVEVSEEDASLKKAWDDFLS